MTEFVCHSLPGTGFCNFSIKTFPMPAAKNENQSKPHSSCEDKSSSTDIELQDCRVLAIDDDPVALRALERHLQRNGCHVTTASSGAEGLEKVTTETAIALIDLRMPGLSGLDCLEFLQKNHPEIPVIILTASSDIDSAVEAMKQGAFQFITKPFEPKSLLVHVAKAFQTRQMVDENSHLKEALSLPQTPARLPTAKSDFGDELLKTVKQMSQLDSTVFIGGESGTGKTNVARLIHQHGQRANLPFVSVNCASLPRDLIESELFGHVKGAFTGAVKDRVGKAEVADGGTLFLDEIGDLPLDLQPKLLTFLQDRVIQRIGCNEDRKLDVRLIVATHRDLAAMCRERRFRQDLYYRLNVLSIQLQPLRERHFDLIQIAKSTIESLCQRENKPTKVLSEQALTQLTAYHWPGNIRELENVLERAVAFSESGEILPADLMFDESGESLNRMPTMDANDSTEVAPSTNAPSALAGMTLEEIEAQAIIETLDACEGNKAKSARMLGISEKSIYNKMKRLDIDYCASVRGGKND